MLRYNPQVITAAMPWEVENTNEFDECFDGFGEERSRTWSGVTETPYGHGQGLPALEHEGTEAAGDEHPGALRLRSARMAILLIGGDKTDGWSEFYEEMIPVADDLYEEHLDELREEGEIP